MQRVTTRMWGYATSTTALEYAMSMQRDLKYWKERCAAAGLNDPVARWVFTNAGTVFLGAKSGELLTVELAEFQTGHETTMDSLKRAVRGWGLDIALVHAIDTRRKVVVYDPARVQADLNEVPRWVFSRLGYPVRITAASFFALIRERWMESGEIPHEVGFGLGYPAKDVMGFMGLVKLDHTGECGWRVYGNPAPSLERGRQFARAKALACACIA